MYFLGFPLFILLLFIAVVAGKMENARLFVQ
jgi:hypothetical protein